MARHRQPDEIADLKGAKRKNPQRYKDAVPKRKDGLGSAPAHMSAGAKNIWAEIESLTLPGVITGSERFIFEITANLLFEYRSAPNEFPAAKLTHLVGCFARLGMTPADRNKLGVDDKPKDDEFNEF